MNFNMYHVSIAVLDLDKSIDFYREALGFTEVRRLGPEDGSYKLVFLSREESQGQIELTWYRDRKEPYNLGDNEIHIGLRTNDFDAAYAKHKGMGCICFENPKLGIYFIADPDGYWLEIVPVR